MSGSHEDDTTLGMSASDRLWMFWSQSRYGSLVLEGVASADIGRVNPCQVEYHEAAYGPGRKEGCLAWNRRCWEWALHSQLSVALRRCAREDLPVIPAAVWTSRSASRPLLLEVWLELSP